MRYSVLVAAHVSAVVTVEAADDEQARRQALSYARDRLETARATYDDWEIASDPTPAPGRG